MHISNLTRKCWNHCSGPHVWFKQVWWNTGCQDCISKYLSRSHDVLLYVFHPYTCLYDFFCLLIVGCTILDHLIENLITTEVVMKKFMICMELYGVWKLAIGPCPETWIWSTVSHCMSLRIVLILSFCLDLGFGVYCSHSCFCPTYFPFLFLIYLLFILPNHPTTFGKEYKCLPNTNVYHPSPNIALLFLNFKYSVQCLFPSHSLSYFHRVAGQI